MDIEQMLAPYRGEKVVLQIDSQEDWDAIIPYLRYKSIERFHSHEFKNHSPCYIFLKNKGYEHYGNAIISEELILFSNLKHKIYECW